ncbi:M28 family peptidase [Sandarakinorhabdus limnophila]|uniref:M28 family peptidase n=1 Tax=Sandarakinorhabdus limnophila TaxID=210512 RepID=UPI0026EBE637|nr:M28 family peptidase [Sandarakinorhabdus limnophila]MCM0031558.1 M28 family peptidase [Sandarakinorhabdus limnophila]
MRHILLAAAVLAAPALAKPDADTKAWLARTAELSSDAMEGRDAGSPGHARAITLVEGWFKAAKLQPAGENGTFRQTVPLHEVAVTAADMRVVAPDGSAAPLKFLHDITPRPATDLPASLSAPMRFAGYCSKAEAGPELKGKIAVCYGSRRAGRAQGAERLAAVTAAGAVALLTIDDVGFTVEPPRWPDAYSRAVAHEGTALPAGLPQFRLNGAALERLMAGTGRLAATLLTEATYHRDLEAFDLPGRFEATLTTAQRRFTSQQVIGLLPGTDKTKAGEVMLLGAHIDGYGFGEPVNGDALYNGTLDDAGYVALISQLAARRKGKGFARPVLFAAWTAEEKGLLGARWWLQHPTVPKEQLVGVINLDQLRPLFPLKALTLHGLDQNTLADTAKSVAQSLKIEIRPDREPERNLIRRVDSWPFMEAGIPAVNFVFAYNPRTEEERIYRDWYQRRYHRPQDDITTPMDLDAARDFNRFFSTLVETAANATAKPVMKAKPTQP